MAFAALFETMPLIRSRISLAALLVKVTARISEGSIRFSNMWAIRQVTVRVLPVPAPASSITGPSSAPTASRWAWFRESNENEEAIGGRMKAGRTPGSERGLGGMWRRSPDAVNSFIPEVTRRPVIAATQDPRPSVGRVRPWSTHVSADKGGRRACGLPSRKGCACGVRCRIPGPHF